MHFDLDVALNMKRLKHIGIEFIANFNAQKTERKRVRKRGIEKEHQRY